MGVSSTYCQICGLPVQLDHYVPAELGSYFNIWRGDALTKCDPIIPFGGEHEWLRRAVGLPLAEGTGETPAAGLVHDGYLSEDGGYPSRDHDVIDVGDGYEDRAAVHDACWGLAGRPGTWVPLERCEPPVEQERYRQQLFDFETFAADGHGWMLVDPDTETPDGVRSRRRIVELLAIASRAT